MYSASSSSAAAAAVAPAADVGSLLDIAGEKKEEAAVDTKDPRSTSDAAAAAPTEVEGNADDKAKEESLEEGDDKETIIPEPQSFRGIVILPPKKQMQQLSGSYLAGSASSSIDEEQSLALPPIRSDEPTAAIRTVLGEVVGLAHYSNYRLELEDYVLSPTNGVQADVGRRQRESRGTRRSFLPTRARAPS
jgi:hypothetical protein